MKKLEKITTNFLRKENIAALLRQIVIDGRLSPGQTVVEARWAHEFDAAQASIREAINLLIAEGFLAKDSGRSARVVDYRKPDVAQIYDVRAALEGAAAELACAQRVDLSPMDAACDRMQDCLSKGNMSALIQRDLDFHLTLIRSTANPVLESIATKLLCPLFAFTQIKVLKSGQGPQA